MMLLCLLAALFFVLAGKKMPSSPKNTRSYARQCKGYQ